jgi:hypothetical protein
MCSLGTSVIVTGDRSETMQEFVENFFKTRMKTYLTVRFYHPVSPREIDICELGSIPCYEWTIKRNKLPYLKKPIGGDG